MRAIIQQQEMKFEQCIPQLLKDPYINVNEQNNVKDFSMNFQIREETLKFPSFSPERRNGFDVGSFNNSDSTGCD
jgi:hypothetical protein